MLFQVEIFAVLKKPEWAKRPCIKRQTRKVRIFFCLFNLRFFKEVAFCIHWILFSKASSLASRHRLHNYIYLYIYICPLRLFRRAIVIYLLAGPFTQFRQVVMFASTRIIQTNFQGPMVTGIRSFTVLETAVCSRQFT